MLLFSSALACVIQTGDVSLAGVTVPIEPSFTVGLEGADVLVMPGDPHAIVVTRPLAFTAFSGSLPIATREPLSLYQGVLTVPADLPVTIDGTRTEADYVQARLPARQLEADDLALPCAALTVTERRPDTVPYLVSPENRRDEVYLRNPAALRHARFTSDPWMASIDGPVHIEVRRPGWLRVAAIWDDGTEVRGWVETSATYRPMFRVGRGYGIGGFGRSTCGRSHGPHLETRTVEAGTSVHTEPDGTAWATYTEPVDVRVFPTERDGWVRIGHTPGLASPPCDEHERLWVRADRLR